MANVQMRRESAVVLEVLIPSAVPSEHQPGVEEAVVEFLLGPDLIRPELMKTLAEKGISASALASAYSDAPLAVCPAVGDRPFIPGPRLAKLASSAKLSFTEGGSLHVDFVYDQAAKVDYPAKALLVRLRVPDAVAGHINEEITGEIFTSLFGDCDLPPRVSGFLAAHGITLDELARSNANTRDGTVPPTTRVSELAARRLARAGLKTDQFGSIKVLEVTAHK